MSFWSDLTGDTAAKASQAAAADTYAKQMAAVSGIKQAGDQSLSDYTNLSQEFQPYVGAGGSALDRLMQGLGLGGGGGEAFTNAYRSMPGYQAALDTGTNNITQNAAAHGLLKSGSALKGLQKFGQNYEDQKSGDYLTRLMGLANTGQSATGQQVATIGTGLQNQYGSRQTAYGGQLSSAGTVGQGDIAAANARAAGSQNLLNTGIKVAGMAVGAAGGIPGMTGSAYGSAAANSGAAGGGYYGTGGQVYPGPGYYP